MIKERLQLRQATIADAELLAALAGVTFRETYTGMMPEKDLSDYITTAFSEAAVSSELAAAGSLFMLAAYDGQPAGYAKLSTTGAPATLQAAKPLGAERIYVQAQFHGLQVGAALMRFCLDYAAQQQFDTVWLAVWERNTPAIRFYQRWGFELFGAQIFMRGNDPQTGLLMKKNIQSFKS